MKVLGLKWNTLNDTLPLASNTFSVDDMKTTKRKVLSIVAQIFDPLGLFLPVIVKSRIFIQNLWTLNPLAGK